jgi:hypothetical protein
MTHSGGIIWKAQIRPPLSKTALPEMACTLMTRPHVRAGMQPFHAIIDAHREKMVAICSTARSDQNQQSSRIRLTAAAADPTATR